ncbi:MULTISPECIES: transcription-repair coupling factor [Dietzia]|uniref:transcription-repair coupling factor n=1 Tax=Dietzia TaxID=37914 RepID=UPI000D092410|nr:MULTISPECIES: transcription-repair coupling factor [Dietzia]AVM63160.1 transcription-repair coupling factor [Dietzia sp. oral taxon 368]MCT1712165.1 transcription-repair coupling factor [Dietzia cinnamea]MCT2273494.1 transcription-repair coupling factor [Dietzia cinnamea]
MTSTAPAVTSTTAALSGLAGAVISNPALADLRAGLDRDTAVVRAPESLRPFLVGALAERAPLLVVTATERECEELADELSGMYDGEVAQFPSWETLPHERLSPAADTIGRRLEVLSAVMAGRAPRIIVAAARSVVQPISPAAARREPVRLTRGAEVDPTDLMAHLAEFAYTREDMVARRGDIAVRGGIVDVFPTTADHPLRIEFDGDEIAEIREFSVADQRSLPDGEVEQVVLYPCRELLLDDDVRARAGQLAAEHRANPTLAELLDSLAEGIPRDGMEALTSVLVPGEMATLPMLMPADTRVVVCDPDKVRRRAADLASAGREFLEASWTAATMGGDAPVDSETLDLSGSGYRTFSSVREEATGAGRAWWQLVPPGFLTDPEDGLVVTVEAGDPPAPRGKDSEMEAMFVQLRALVGAGGRAAMVVPGHGTVTRILERLSEAEVPATAAQAGSEPADGLVTVYEAVLHAGFALTGGADGASGDFVVVSETDLTGNRLGSTARPKARHSKRRNQVDPLALKAGDLVVHDQHGIGRFVEMVERQVRGGDGSSRREYLVIEYAPGKRGAAGDRLYVPMESLGQLSRYVGGEAPTLSKMGGADWQNTKRKARKAVREIATELVQLYAKRQSAPGRAFGPDTPWQREMEDAFPFTETVDQLSAIEEVKGDMEKSAPMDRVVVGDVGYGKTEVAVRAAFKAVQDGTQVAVLVPTTLLAQQHLATFTERMTGFPVTIKGLSRFTSDAEAKEVLKGLADGTVDVVIGTHRLLATGVRWKNLGLVIVDEEQRFGVEHKEHITSLRTHVDVLTMSATPIPRTLEMSLAGIREMSQILTPPEERLPVLTYVGAYSDKHVAAAIRRELLREGQIFYVHNRVRTIDSTAARIRDLVPEARVVVAHGQMGEEQLEQTVGGFWNREYDVLVCTTIVETGLDISNANTLIVDRSDQLGLSQMHQLRGRVGRSRERGYAYFLYDPEKPLTETAYDRLATIAQNNDLGAGMAVAMKDLELRGAGNVLGAEQSGHIAGVGFDLYIRLVGEAVEAYRAIADGEKVETQEELGEIRIELPVDAFIPPDYVDGDRLRLEAYRKLSQAREPGDIDAVVEELLDRYGPLPVEARRVVSVARLRLVAQKYRVREIVLAGSRLRVGPLDLLDSQQMRLKRMYPAAQYRATQKTVLLPLPKAAGARAGAGGEKARDDEMLQYAADFLTAMAGDPEGSNPVIQPETAPAR